MRGTSNAPLILGVIASILEIPGFLCVACIGGLAAAGGSGGMGIFIAVVGAIPVVLGFIGASKGKSEPNTSFILLLISGILCGIAWVLGAFTSLFSLVSLVLFIIGAILAKVQRME